MEPNDLHRDTTISEFLKFATLSNETDMDVLADQFIAKASDAI